MRRISWTELHGRYVNGSMTLNELARDHGVNAGSLRRRAARTDALLQESTRQSVLDAAEELAAYNADDLRVAKQMRELVERQLSNDRNLSACDIRQLALTVESMQKVARLALGASTSNEVPIKPVEPDLNLMLLSDEEFELFSKLLEKCSAPPRKGVKPPDDGKLQ